MTQKSTTIAGSTTVSEGESFRIRRIDLTPEGTAMLSTGLKHGIHDTRAGKFLTDKAPPRPAEPAKKRA